MNYTSTDSLPEPSLQLWIVVVSAACIGLLLLSLLFIGTALVCRRRKNMRYIYQTKPIRKKNGSHGSSYSVRSHGRIELFTLDECVHEASQQQLPTGSQQLLATGDPSHARESRASQPVDDTDQGDAVIYAELESPPPEPGNFNRQSAVRRSIRSDSGRGTHSVHRGLSRRPSVQSESGIDARLHHGEEKERFARHKAISMSVRCTSSTRGGALPSLPQPPQSLLLPRSPQAPQLTITEAGRSESKDDGLGSSLPHLAIRQVSTSSSSKHKTISPSSTSRLSDHIPGFRDPEILSNVADMTDSLEQLTISLPPDIYSSQILQTVQSPQWPECPIEDDENESEQGQGRMFRFVSKISRSTQSLTGFISLPHGMVAPDSSTQVNIFGDEEGNTEVFYDQPLRLVNSSKNNLLDTDTLFDDPGYNKLAAASQQKDGHFYHTLDPPVAATAATAATPDTSNMKRGGGGHLYHTLEPPSNMHGEGTGKRKQRICYENVCLDTRSAVPVAVPTGVVSTGAVLQELTPFKPKGARYENVALKLEGDVTAKSKIQKAKPKYENVVLGNPVAGGVKTVVLGNPVAGGVKTVVLGNPVAGGVETVVPGNPAAGGVETFVPGNPAAGIRHQLGGVPSTTQSVVLADQAAGNRLGGSTHSLSVLDYQENELMDLDPDIASCLFQARSETLL